MRLKVLMIIFFWGITSLSYGQSLIDISRESAIRIGIKIWYNECNGKISGLTTWNEGERFASLGIGHFNWYPDNRTGSPKDGFPQLIKYMEHNGVTVPSWLQGETLPPCPWRTRAEFEAAQHSQKMQELRQFLADTIPIQAQFMVYRLVNAFPRLITRAPCEERGFIFDQFATLATSPKGMYALVDYVNFKGEGTGTPAPNSSGWGLLQVIEGMKEAPQQLSALEAFVWSADHALTQRAYRTSATHHELKWLPGWRKRLLTYLE